MEVVYSRCCASLDVHKESVAVCVHTPDSGAEPKREIREFGTTTRELRRLREWRSRTGSRMPTWSPRVCIGSRCSTFWRVPVN